MTTRRHLFLDLEDTIITPVVGGWHDFELINVQTIRDVVVGFNPHSIHIFSFAIWDDRQRDLFNYNTREHVERAIGTELSWVPTVEELMEKCCHVRRISPSRVEFSDVVDFWGKAGTFRIFCEQFGSGIHGPTDLVFLDDAVINETFQLHDQKLTARIINIDHLRNSGNEVRPHTIL